MAFLHNAWYVAAFSKEVSSHAPFSRTLLNRPVVLYRDERGEIVALDDRCPHRFAPLSRGRVVEGAIECPYHGLRFASTGRCVLNPHGDGRIPAAAEVRRYPTRERYGAIWIWPGNPELADTAPLREFGFLEPERYFTGEGYLLTRANYQLSADNLLDLSHFQYLHPNTLGSDTMARGTLRSSEDGDKVWVRRQASAELLQPFVAEGFAVSPGKRADRELDVCWEPPGLLTVIVRVRETGAPPEATRIGISAHWLTPETESSTHYFFALGLPREAGEEGRLLVQTSVEGLMVPFRDEDLPMLEAQQRALGSREFWAMAPVMLSIDAGAIRARRIMERLIANEGAASGGTELSGVLRRVAGRPDMEVDR
jgi:phenylpropionate dioxygenase-like ring-hydroxylating dioxygenase large terminal subunit